MDLFQQIAVQGDLLQQMRQNYVAPGAVDPATIKVPSRLQRLITPTVLGKWGKQEVGFDYAWRYNPVVRYDLLTPARCFGGIAKGGEVDDTIGPDSWMSPNSADDIQKLYNQNLVRILYYFTHCGAYWLNNNMTETGVRAMDNYSNPDQRMNAMLSPINGDPEFRLICRNWHIGTLDAATMHADVLAGRGFRLLNGIMLDCERAWRSYNEYITNKGDLSKCKLIDGYWIGLSNKILYERLKWAQAHYYLPPDIKIIFYSGKWFINAYSKELGTFLEDKDTIPAIYYYSASISTTIEDMKSVYLNAIPDNWLDQPAIKDRLFGNPIAVQVAPSFKIPEFTNTAGVPVTVDVNSWIATTPPRTYFGLDVVPPPTPTCPGGQHWDDVQKKCVDDVVIPPPTGTYTIDEVYALLQKTQADVQTNQGILKDRFNVK